jgi:hypothetical protein
MAMSSSNMEGLKGSVNGFSYFNWFSVISFSNESLSPIRRGFAPGFVNYKKGCTVINFYSQTSLQRPLNGESKSGL